MNAFVGVVSRQGPTKNPLIKRLLESLQGHRPGVGMNLQIEVGEQYTRGEKRQRIFEVARLHGARYVCILEDDTEILEEDWLVRLLQPMIFGDILGMVNPMESRDGVRPNLPQLKGQIVEVVQCYGFCILYDLAWGPRYDPRITWLDDLAMSLQCRAAGRRVVTAGVTTVRHSKEPFLRDDLPPWRQSDRSRWGEGNAYYQERQFTLERRAEAQLLIAQYGEMARMSVPPDLLDRPTDAFPAGGSVQPPPVLESRVSAEGSEVDRVIAEWERSQQEVSRARVATGADQAEPGMVGGTSAAPDREVQSQDPRPEA